jgi:hypothetical protein
VGELSEDGGRGDAGVHGVALEVEPGDDAAEGVDGGEVVDRGGGLGGCRHLANPQVTGVGDGCRAALDGSLRVVDVSSMTLDLLLNGWVWPGRGCSRTPRPLAFVGLNAIAAGVFSWPLLDVIVRGPSVMLEGK